VTYSFKLTIDRNPRSPVITVEDLSTTGLPPAELQLPLGTELPYRLAVDHAASARGTLVVKVDEPFDPDVTRDSNVLHVEASLTDHRFDTRDDTKYVLHVSNRSRYYLAEDIQVRVRIDDPTAELVLDDGNLALSLMPCEQHIQCIDPGQTRDLTFIAIARSPKPGLYTVEVNLAYRIVYWDGRRAHDTTRHLLPVHSPGRTFEIPTKSPALMPRQPTLSRSEPMSDERQKTFFAPLPAKTHHRHLKPIEQHFPLPGGGHLDVAYRLLKGHHPDGDNVPCTYGRHPDCDSIVWYFSTQDTAVLEVMLENESHHHLKHVRLSGIQILTVDEKSSSKVVDQMLPDGNLLFEVVPDDVYFGHLAPHAKATKFLSLITRGVHAGHYTIKVEVNYDIEQCHFPVDLWLTVRPD
jgi:hypothetical protein